VAVYGVVSKNELQENRCSARLAVLPGIPWQIPHVDAGEETVISHAMPGSTAIIAAQLALFFERAPYRPS
jgi:hypothetical protein